MKFFLPQNILSQKTQNLKSRYFCTIRPLLFFDLLSGPRPRRYAPATNPGDQMLLDTAVIDELREALGDDTYRSFAARMLAEVEQTATALQALLDAADFETLARTAHRTAGSAAGTGAKGLHALLKQIENTARDADSRSALPALLASITPQAEATRTALHGAVGPL